MSNTQAFCTSAKVKALKAIVDNGDTLDAALYFASASLGAGTTAYTTSGEATGTGYTAGGIAVTHGTAATSSGTTAFWTPSASLVYTGVTISAFDTVLIYNSTDSNSAIGVFTFGSQTIVAGTFTLTMPTNDASNGLMRIA